MVVADDAIFLSNFGGGEVWRAPASGGEPTFLARPDYPPMGMALAGDLLYFLSFDGRFWSVPTSGDDDAEVLTPLANTQAVALVIDGETPTGPIPRPRSREHR